MNLTSSSGPGPRGPGQNKKKLRAQALKQKEVDKQGSGCTMGIYEKSKK